MKVPTLYSLAMKVVENTDKVDSDDKMAVFMALYESSKIPLSYKQWKEYYQTKTTSETIERFKADHVRDIHPAEIKEKGIRHWPNERIRTRFCTGIDLAPIIDNFNASPFPFYQLYPCRLSNGNILICEIEIVAQYNITAKGGYMSATITKRRFWSNENRELQYQFTTFYDGYVGSENLYKRAFTNRENGRYIVQIEFTYNTNKTYGENIDCMQLLGLKKLDKIQILYPRD